jgi:hypothetical protein
MALRRGFPTRFIIQQARAADTIAVGEDGRDALADPIMQTNPSDLVMQTGRPLLVVPDTCSWLDMRSVLVAWKDTPEARRAIADALPTLRQANDINMVEIIEDDQPAGGIVRGEGRRRLVVTPRRWLPRGRYLTDAAMPPHNSKGSRRRLAPASSLRVPTVIRGFGNGFSVV